MDVRLIPHSTRPGIGLKPRRDTERPQLPDHARHCPVLTAGSALGFMVYPPLAPNESYRLEYEGDGKYLFTFFTGAASGNLQPMFSLSIGLPVGGIGSTREEITLFVRHSSLTLESARDMARALIVPEDCGTPAGGLALRGAHGFQTPPGWDTLYAPIFNNVEHPVAPMLVVRVQTDWFAHDTEFRYVVQPGEGVQGLHTEPIGQVLFVPREEITLRDCTPEEIEAIRETEKTFYRDKATVSETTADGFEYSPHYSRRAQINRTSR